MERRPLPALRDGRWSTYDVSVLKKMGGKMRTDRTPSKATITNKTRPAGSFSSSWPGRTPCRLGFLCICLFSDGNNGSFCGFEAILRARSFWSLPGDQFTSQTQPGFTVLLRQFQPWHISPPDFGTKLFIT